MKMNRYFLNNNTNEMVIYNEADNDIVVLKEVAEAVYEDEEKEEVKVETKEKPKKEPKKEPKKKEKTQREGGDRKTRRTSFDEETLNKIKKLVLDGKKPWEIVNETGICLTAAYKYYKEFKSEPTIKKQTESHHKNIIKKKEPEFKPFPPSEDKEEET